MHPMILVLDNLRQNSLSVQETDLVMEAKGAQSRAQFNRTP